MKLYPAIDLLNGKSVRLTQGDYDQVSLTEDPLYQAQRLTDAGFAHLHLVDLDGARAQRPINRTVITRIREQTSAFIELGGGIRTLAAMEIYLTIGIDRLILGSAAVSDPDLVEQAIARFGSNRIAVGIDTRAGKVATNGWLTTSQQTANALLTAMPQATIIASGGISSLADLHRLQTAGIQAAIIGKAWQTGAIELAMLKQMEG